MVPDRTLKQVTRIPAGTRFEARLDNRNLAFTTAWDLQLSPLRVRQVELSQAPFRFSPKMSASAMLHLQLSCADPDLKLDALNLDRLPFHIDGEPTICRTLYDLIMGQLPGICVSGGNPGDGIYLEISQLKPISADQFLLPQPAVSFSGYQQLMEVLAYPDPFMGFVVEGLREVIARLRCRELNIYLLLKEAPPELAGSVRAERFRTGTVPVVNLFPCQAEPMVIDYGRMREEVVPDAQSADDIEVWQVSRVCDITRHVPEFVPPLYGDKFGDSETGLYWLEVGGRDAQGRLHTYLSLSDIDYNPAVDDRRVFAVDTLCCNGNLPRSLGRGTAMVCQDNIEMAGQARLLHSPTVRRLPPTGYEAAWSLLSHLQMNYEDLFSHQHPEQNLRLLMRLHMRGRCPDGDAWIESLRDINITPATAPVYIGSHHCLARGLKVTITIDPEPLRESSLYLLVHTLDRLAASYAGFDSFLQLAFTLQGQYGVRIQCRRHQARQAGL